MEAARPLATLDPAAPLDDLSWLDAVVGDARVVAIGESSHYNRELLQLRHRVVRHLVERHGFGAFGMETGHVEGWQVDAWVHGGDGRIGDVLANGITSLMGLWTETRALVEWLRAHPVGFTGIDLSGSNVSLLPALDAVTAYLGQAEPEHTVDPALRTTAAVFSAPSAFAIPAAFAGYAGLPAPDRDALTAGLADLQARVTARRAPYVRATGAAAYERALRAAQLLCTLDALFRDLARGDTATMALHRDVAMADTVEAMLRGGQRVVLAAHNGHVQRIPATLPGIGDVAGLGTHLADRLGADYVVVGTTTGSGRMLYPGEEFYAGTLFTDLPAPEPGTLDALMAASHDGPFAVDLHRLPPADLAAIRATKGHRHGPFLLEQDPTAAFDALVHLPLVGEATVDREALAASPPDVQEAFGKWLSR
ncbi:erythromycin esterase [Pseudonocardia sp. CNS-139]|nr:erythromycin esterase [Pseudonocardia sp. CNS-139]